MRVKYILVLCTYYPHMDISLSQKFLIPFLIRKTPILPPKCFALLYALFFLATKIYLLIGHIKEGIK